MLSDKQRLAISMIVAGIRFREVEEALAISHTQLWRWRQELEFAAALERQRAIEHERRRDRMWSVVERSMDVILDSLDEGDPKMAIDVLRIGARGLTDVRYTEEDQPMPVSVPESARLPVSEDQYVCTECEKVCKTSSGLERHVKVHAA